MTINLEDRVILITGAARGLGLAYAQSLHTHGATVAMHDGGVDQDGTNPNPQLIRDVAKSVGEERTFAVSGLLNSRSECEQVVQAVINRYGRIDGLINNAGIVLWEDTVDVDEDTFRTSSSVNHEAAFWVTQAALKQMRKQNYGRIVL
ncbi:MAG: SDR family NAD(P)-dependent oxidoreductase, partial [Pseudomonadota bacterium]